MLSLEHVKLLESKVTRTIEVIKSLSEENAVLRSKLDRYQGRIGELETLIKSFKEDQGKIESGILAAIEKLNQLEDSNAPQAVQMPETEAAIKPSAEPSLDTGSETTQLTEEDSGNELDIF